MKAAPERFWTLDAMRGLAALAVVAWHGGVIRPLPGAYLAVDLFFCLSGFVLAHAYQDRKLGVRRFMTARVIRLYPMYLAGLLLGVVVALNSLPANARYFTILGASLLMLPAAAVEGRVYHPFPMNGPSWSLFLELVINAVWIVIAPVLRWWVLILVLAAGVWMTIDLAMVKQHLNVGSSGEQFFWRGFRRILFPFFAGVAVYRLWKIEIWRPRLPSLVVLVGLALLFVVRATPLYRDLFAVLIGIPALVFLGACCRPSPPFVPMFAALGAVSYGIYVLHWPLLQLLRPLFYVRARVPEPWVLDLAPAALTPYLLTACAITGSAALTLGLNRYYDTPVRAWLNRLTRGKPPPPTERPL